VTGPEEKRNARINSSAAVWRALKPTLTVLGADKCWYCEHIPARDFLKVDHFRPKNGVEECPAHPGYWWLAFEPSNYRLACSFCNGSHAGLDGTVGKQAHFPLVDESKRVMNEHGDIADEAPSLLDPAVEKDVESLWFLEDGSVDYRDPDAPDDDPSRVRTELSIKIYDLNGIKLQEKRKDRMQAVRDLVEKADYGLFRVTVDGSDDSIDKRVEHIMDTLKMMADRSQEYSVAVLHALRTLRESPTASSVLALLAR
jgi:hypothetical protein